MATLAVTVAVGAPLNSAMAAPPEAGAPSEPGGGAEGEPSDRQPAPEPEPTADPKPEPAPDPEPGAGAGQQARERTTTRPPSARDAAQDARERAADQARSRAKAAAQARARAAKRATQLAAAGQRARVSWESHGQPHKMITIKQRGIDLVQDGRLLRQVPRSGGALTLASLARFVPADWLTVDNGTAEVFAAIVLTPGQSLTLGGDVRNVRLAGGATPSDAASIYTGRGRLALRGVTIDSFDPASRQPLPAGPGRPFIVVSGGGRIESVDSAVNDLGTRPGDPTSRAGLGLGETSTGSLLRTSFARNGIGLRLDRTDGVRLEGVAVTGSVGDGLVLRGDRGTALIGITADGNGGNGVLLTGPSSDRPVTGISAADNQLFGVAMVGQITPQLNNITTARNKVGGMRVSASTAAAINDFTSTEDAIGVYTHVGSENVVIDRARIVGARRGLQIEKTTRGLTMRASTIAGSSITGISVGGHQVELSQVAVTDSATAMRVERGADDVVADGLTISGGQDGLVALSATKNVVLRDLAVSGVSRTAVRTFSPGLQLLGSRITGSSTGIDVGAATTITGATIGAVDEGIRSRSDDPVDVNDTDISALAVGINVAPGSPVKLAGSHIDALEAIRGTLAQDGLNELSLPPVNLLGAIGVPLILLALVLEQVQAFRQRGSGYRTRRLPPPAPVRTA